MPLVAAVGDIHGNAVAFEAVLDEIREARPDIIALCGDFTFDGPEPDLVVDMVRDLEAQGALVLQGHADMLVADFDFRAARPDAPRYSTSLRAVAEWTHEVLGPERVGWLRQLPNERRLWIDDLLLLFCHASPGSSTRPLELHRTDIRPSELQTDARVICCGHTHIPGVRRAGGRTLINVGTVGVTLDGDPRASWALVDVTPRSVRVEIRRVQHDTEKVAGMFLARGLPGDRARVRALRSAGPQG